MHTRLAVLVVAIAASISTLAAPSADAVTAPTGSISGIVTVAATGTPASGVEVDLVGAVTDADGTGPQLIATGRTAADGSYSFTGLAADTKFGYQVCFATSTDYEQQCYANIAWYPQRGDQPGDGSDFVPGTPLLLAAGQNLTGISASLQPSSTVSGAVTDAKTGLPVDDAQISFINSTNTLVFVANSDSSGNYVVALEPGNTYSVCFTEYGTPAPNGATYLRSCYPQTITVVAHTPIIGISGQLDTVPAIIPSDETVAFGQPSTFGYRVVGLDAGDALATSPTCGVAAVHTKVGTYPIVCTGATLVSGAPIDETATGTLTVTLGVSTAGLPTGTVQTTYSGKLTSTGGTGAISYALASGALPAGLKLASAGTVTGTPTSVGTVEFAVRVTDHAKPPNTVVVPVAIVIGPITVKVSSLPTGLVGKAYQGKVISSGGKSPFAWSVAGALPPGVKFTTSGTFTGTPTAAGSYPLTVTVTDSAKPAKDSASLSVTLTIAPMSITTATLPGGTVTKAYHAQLAYTGGTGNHLWALVGPALPPGIKFSTGGLISGTPTAAGTYNLTFKVTDGAKPTANVASHTYAFTVS